MFLVPNGMICGRPFIVGKNARTTLSKRCSYEDGKFDSSWTQKSNLMQVANTPLAQEAGRLWLEQAEGEHASVASFARNALQLLSSEVPSDILMLSHQAASDEIKHAKICYGLATTFLGDDFTPGTLDVERSLEKSDLKRIARSIIQEGAIAETIAAVEAKVRAHTAKDSSIKTAVSQIARDESNHAQLAWSTIKWMRNRFAEITGLVEETISVEMGKRLNSGVNEFTVPTKSLSCDCDFENTLPNHGLIDNEGRKKIQTQAIRNIISPAYNAELKDADLISQMIDSLDLNVIS